LLTVLTLGIDLAAQPKNTAACVIQWRNGLAEVSRVVCGLDDGAVIELVQSVDKAGIDIPLGWPTDFVQSVFKHQELKAWPKTDRLRLRYRETDLFVHDQTGRWPLSVSTDRIGVATMRAAALMGKMKEPVDRSGRYKIVEVYPAAAMRIWGFDPRGYKGKKGQEARSSLVGTLLQGTSAWLRVQQKWRTAFIRGDNEFDALIAALVTRASAVGLTEPVPPSCVDRATVEGWIALPLCGSLDKLASGTGEKIVRL
jgi:predicted nuclease with RNAse H fold